LILFILADLNDPNSGAFLIDIFSNMEITDELSQKYIIFGIENGED